MARVGTTAAVAVIARAGKAATIVATGAAAMGARPGLVLQTGGGEDCRTLGWNLCPPRVFTMARFEKEKRW